jgi:hypothetical protein
MTDESEETRNPREAIEEIREKRKKGNEPDSDEREFLEGERVKIDPDLDENSAPPTPPPVRLSP